MKSPDSYKSAKSSAKAKVMSKVSSAKKMMPSKSGMKKSSCK